MDELRIQGRTLTAADLAHVRECLSGQPDWSRKRLSIHLAERWDWRNGRGQLKDMAARTMLLKLERHGLIELLAARSRNGNANRYSGSPPLAAPAGPPGGPLGEFEPLSFVPVCTAAQRRILAQALRQFHYLGLRQWVGETVGYLIYTQGQQLLALLLFGAAAWKVAARDQFIGWPPKLREQNLQFIANNCRFLILPWARVAGLASHLLARVARRLSADWQQLYQHPIYWLETFIEPARFGATCYRAANWFCLGLTTGRGKDDLTHRPNRSLKELWVQPLGRNFRQQLCRPGHE